MRIIPTIIKLLILLCTSFAAHAQPWPSSLLWRITGNGLDKPSYLYGTMHLKDRRLFFFGDSLYNSIQNSKGFAMEIDPHEIVDSLFSKLSEEFENSPFLKDMVDKDKYDKVAKKLEKKLGIPAEKITKRKLIHMRNEWLYKTKKPDDMNTMVDLYLYDLAKQQGKWVGGIEDVNDQLGLIDELGKSEDINTFVEDIDKKKPSDYLEKMIAVYVNQDIDKLEKMFSYRDRIDIDMIRRNLKMARRMDSLAHIRNSFFAVGAAHLPGDSGVIKLLQAKGFTVEPVFSSKKIAPEAYKFTKVESSWYAYTAEDSAYTVEMPGKPSDFNLFGDEVKFKVYADLVNNTAYMTGYVFIPEGEEEKRLQMMKESFTRKGFKKLEEKKILQRGVEGTEIISVKDALYYRIQFFVNNSKAFIVMADAEKKESIYNASAARFFGSFTANLKLEAKSRTWTDFTDAVKGFSITFPGKPAIHNQPAQNGTESFDMITYSTVDVANSTYYLLAVAETQKGFMVTDDSLIFNAKTDYYQQNGYKISDLRKFELNDFPAISLTAVGKNQGIDLSSKLLVVSRGNRSYTLVIVTEKGKEDYPDVSRFLRSFSLLPYQTSGWSDQKESNKNFYTWAPSKIRQLPLDTAGLAGNELDKQPGEMPKEIQYMAYDTNTATNYNITLKTISKYYWAKSDSLFFTNELDTYYKDTGSYFAKYSPGNYDSLVYIKQVNNAGEPGYEILVKNASKSYYKRVRAIRHADTVCHLVVMAPYSTISSENNNLFFENFGFDNRAQQTSIYNNKTALILNDLLSTDSATREAAGEALGTAAFTVTDLSLLQQAFLKHYPDDTAGYYSIADKLIDKIKQINDTATISFVKDNYDLVPEANNKKMLLLELLANNKTQLSVQLLKELLLTAPPKNGRPSRMFFELEDSLLLAKNMFPEAAKFFADTIYGPGLISLGATLVDSNLLERSLLYDHRDAIKAIAKWRVKKIKFSPEDYDGDDRSVIGALKIIGDKEAIAALNQYAAVSQSYVKREALTALLKMGQQVAPMELRKLATDPEYRTELYDTLKAMDKLSLFPKDFLSQPKFAESYLVNYAYEDDMESSDITFHLLGEKITTEKNAAGRYYIFKMTVKYDEEKYDYPAICGPFDVNKLKPALIGEKRAKIFYDEQTTPININKLFAQFLKEQQENK